MFAVAFPPSNFVSLFTVGNYRVRLFIRIGGGRIVGIKLDMLDKAPAFKAGRVYADIV